MLKDQAVLISRIAMMIDSVILIVSLGLSYTIINSFSGVRLVQFANYAWVLLLILPLWLILLHRYRLYASIRRLGPIDIAFKLLNAQIVACLILGFLIYIFDKTHFSRTLFVAFGISSYFLLLFEKLSVRAVLGYFRRKGFNTRHLLIVGTQEKATTLSHLVEEHKNWGLRVVGFLQAVEDEPLLDFIEGHKVLGYASELMKICKAVPVDEVIFCLPRDLILDAEEHFLDLEEMGITVRMVLDFYELRNSKRELGLFHGELPILTFHSKCLDPQQLLGKRLIDIAGAFIGLSITVLLFPFIALAIKLDSPGPLLFGQERVGECGRKFTCWKFRSMYIDAEERKQELMAQNEMNGAIFKIKDDPRITRVGKVLRKTSLDELPQFWNVLIGEMSLVGTRPPTPEEVKEYENWHRRRISIKPGITGLWQVSGRNQINDFDEIVRLDIAYIDNWNIWLDIKLLLKTVKVVFARNGSC